MLSLFIRNLIFTILQPGIVVGLIPYLILDDGVSNMIADQLLTRGWHDLGMVVFVIGLAILVWCIISFAVQGQGTLSPIDPTKRLVVKGLYRHSRNPMYVGVVLILIGEAIFFQSTNLWIYALIVFIAFNLFAILVEEPRLRKDFGEAYAQYCSQVRRWV